MPKEIMGILTYTADETAAILGVTKRTLISYLKTGKIVAGKIGGSWAITEKQIKDFITQGSLIDNRPGSAAAMFPPASKPRKVRVIRKERPVQEEEPLEYPTESPGEIMRREMAEDMPPFMAEKLTSKPRKKG